MGEFDGSNRVAMTKGETILVNEQPVNQEHDFPVGLAQPARRALAGAGYSRLEQLTQVSEAELKRLHGMGPKALEQLRTALQAHNLSFAAAKQSGDTG